MEGALGMLGGRRERRGGRHEIKTEITAMLEETTMKTAG